MGRVRKSVRFAILVRDGFTCRYCGRSAPTVELHVDHVEPWSLGGSNAPDNLVTACTDCNLGKSDRPLPLKVGVDAAQPTIVPSVPYPDTCDLCWRATGVLTSYAARSETPCPPDGYVAYYMCDRGHIWNSYWTGNARWPADDIDAEIAHVNADFAASKLEHDILFATMETATT